MWQDLPLFPESASSVSGAVDLLYGFLVLVSTFFTLLIAGLLVFFAVRYRRTRKGAMATHIEGSLKLEVLWTVIPLILAVSFFWWGARLFFEGQRPPAGAMVITVTGKQWMWKIQHPTGHREINALHVPVGVPVRLEMISEDVIHDFYVPAFRTKLDVLPGRYSSTWFEATVPGEYHLFCAEYCGAKHSNMIGTVTVMEPADYEQWLAGTAANETPRETGRKVFTALRCDTCHSSASGARGPNLAGRFGSSVELEGGGQATFDAKHVRESLLDPRAKITRGYQPLMPTYTGQLNEEQILALIAYLESTTLEEAGGDGQ
jgi:cytochrome c oxidase subunit 2